MYLEYLFLGGYGKFVWPAFILTFTSCTYLYIKTRSELKRYEKMFFLEFKELKTIKIDFDREKKEKAEVKEILSVN